MCAECLLTHLNHEICLKLSPVDTNDSVYISNRLNIVVFLIDDVLKGELCI